MANRPQCRELGGRQDKDRRDQAILLSSLLSLRHQSAELRWWIAVQLLAYTWDESSTNTLAVDQMEHVEHVFLDPLEPTSWLHDLVRSAIARITEQNFGTRFGNNGCIFIDIGEYLVAIVRMLSQLAQQLSHGRHIQIYNERRLQEMERDDDFSMLGPIDYMSDQHRNLK